MSNLLVANKLKDKPVLIIGGGFIGSTRLIKLIPTGCKITVISEEFHSKFLENKDEIEELRQVSYDESQLNNTVDGWWYMVLVCITNGPLSQRIYDDVKRKFGPQQLINIADKPELCDFYFGSNITIGDNLQILVSSNGQSPRFTKLIVKQINDLLDHDVINESVVKLGQLREKVRNISNLQLQVEEFTIDSDEGEENEKEAEKEAEKNKPCRKEIEQLKEKILGYRMWWVREITNIFGIEHCYSIRIDELCELYKEMLQDYSKNFVDKDEMIKKYTIV